MKLDEKGLEAAWTVYHGSTNDQRGALSDAIRAYLEAATPPDVARLADTLDAIEIVRIRANIDALGINPIETANRAIRQAATALRLSAGGGAIEIETIARAIDPDAWADDFPGWIRSDVIAFYVDRARSIATAKRVVAALKSASPTVEAGHVE